MQATFSLIEDYEAAGGAKPVSVKELTDSFIVIGGKDSAQAPPVAKPVDLVADDAAMARARKELEDSIAQSRAQAAPTHKEAEKPAIIESVLLTPPAATAAAPAPVKEEKKEETTVAPTALQKLPVVEETEPIEATKNAFELRLKGASTLPGEDEETAEEKAVEAALNAPALPKPHARATPDEIVAQIVAAENLHPVVDTRSDAALATAMAAEMAGGVGNALAIARRDEVAREAKMRDVKAVQKFIDEERKKVEMLREVKKEGNTAKLELSRDSLAAKGGEVLVWGKGTDGQLGIPKCPKVQLVPASLPFFADKIITQIACGRNHTILLSANGAIFSFGVSNQGQCGHGDTMTAMSPRAIAALEGANVRWIAAGDAHSACVTDTGKVLTWGASLWGQLGLGKQHLDQPVTKPTPVTDIPDTMKVACGGMHTIAVTPLGQCYAWGNNDKGQLGLGQFIKKPLFSTPQEVLFFHGRQPEYTVSHVSCGQSHTAWVAGGRLYTAGDSKDGKMGIDLPPNAGEEDLRKVHPVKGLPEAAVEVSCGGNHTVVRTASGLVYCFGKNSNGQCGDAASASIPHPRALSHTSTFVSIAASENGSAAISQLGELYTWGEGSFGQLGHESRVDVAMPTIVPYFANISVRQVALAAAHTVALVNLLSAVAQDLKHTLSAGVLADVSLVASSRRLPAHRAVLSRSPFFKALFDAQPEATVIDVPADISYEQLLLAVEFIYTDFVRVSAEKANAILPIADKFELPKFSALLKKCAADNQTPSAEGDKLIPYMAELLEYGRYGDVVFFFPRKSQKLRAHRAVLAARCEYFRTMFLSGMKEAESAEITVTDVRLPAFRRLLSFLYTGNCSFNEDGSLAVELLMLSHRYRVYALKSLCEGLIEPAVTSDNCLMLLEIADVHQAGRVRSKALSVALGHPELVNSEAWAALAPALQEEVGALMPKQKETRSVNKMNNSSNISVHAGEVLESATVADYGALRPSKDFAAALKRAREAAHHTHSSLATAVGEKAAVIRSLEGGKGTLSLKLVDKLERVLRARLRHLCPALAS